MRSRALVSITAVLAATAAVAGDSEDHPAPSAAPPHVVYLYGLHDLEKLKSANPDHYARAERILAASDELCRPGPDRVYFAQFEARDISCEGSLLLTSYPAKRRVAFTLDRVRYVALVTVHGEPVRPMPALQAKPASSPPRHNTHAPAAAGLAP